MGSVGRRLPKHSSEWKAKSERRCVSCGVVLVRPGERAIGRTTKCRPCHLERPLAPGEYLARIAMAKAGRAGQLIRPAYCMSCAVDCEPEGHHFAGYLGTNALKVIWLCRKCHARAHASMRWEISA